MKHRSIVVFTVLLMGLSVVPQAARELIALRDAAGNNLQAGIWNVFLSYHAQKVAGDRQTANTLVAAQSCPQTAVNTTQVAQNTRKSDNAVRSRNQATPGRQSGERLDVEDVTLPLDFVAFNFDAAAPEAEMHFAPLPSVPDIPVTIDALRGAGKVAPIAPGERSPSHRVAVRKNEKENRLVELKVAGIEREAALKAVELATRALRTREAGTHFEDVLKINFDAAGNDGSAHLKARRFKIPNKAQLRHLVPKATGAKPAPQPAVPGAAC